jgi:ubiquitin-protein ligase E3 C
MQNGSAINVRIRRDYIYEDAFEKLSPDNGEITSSSVAVTPVIRLEPNLRRKIRVNFINAVGLDEAGVDGGGLFREFMNELLKTSFNPIRGLFKLTSDGYLYPNPNVAFIYENFNADFYFLGRILGKVRARERDEKAIRWLLVSVLGYLREISG